MSSVEARQALGRAQRELLRALVGGGESPPGFDPAAVRLTALVLEQKRLRSVQRAWPMLTRAMGEAMGEHFAAYAADCALPHDGGPVADGWGFARFLAARGQLPAAARREVLAVELRFVATPTGLRPRRGPALRLARVAGRFVLALRVSRLGEWWLRLPV